jgi:hypothetical protein
MSARNSYPLKSSGNVRSYTFTVFTHDDNRPWVILGSERRMIELEDQAAFTNWAQHTYPRDRFSLHTRRLERFVRPPQRLASPARTSSDGDTWLLNATSGSDTC